MNRRQFLKTALSGGAIVLIGSYPILIERMWVQINHYKIPVPDLPPAFNGFTIAHLTDIHLGDLVSEAFVAGVIQRTNQLNTNIIVCTGDYVNEIDSSKDIDRVWPLLSKLSAKEGVYSVLGNHDHWANTGRSLYWLERSGQNIRHQAKAIYRGRERIIIGGTGDLWHDRLNIDSTFAPFEPSDCKIVLAHNPDSVDSEFNSRVSLVLSGHTHGGQVVIPFIGPLRLPVENQQYSSGLIMTPKTPLFISRGIGWSILPVRFNCYPEIAVLELVRPFKTAI